MTATSTLRESSKTMAFTLLATAAVTAGGLEFGAGTVSARQLIDGADDVYRVVADGNGALYWQAAGPISDWTFDPDSPRPGPSTRSAGLCYQGSLT
ncbi:hypothetical protein ACQP1G_16205 [Nocardia sp. CA-107356]|uniref:hypothetical protein n=1 Tax=Nocardia sp. CA-107356 TaxID=3239972 RepID=UPI003D93BA01